MIVIRLSKIALVTAAGLFCLLVGYNNIVDYGSNFMFVQHVLSMDTTFPDNALRTSRAILNPQWRNQRIDFHPYPFASYTEELVRLLRKTQVEGDTAFLRSLSPEAVARDLVTDRFVRRAIARNGGAAAFRLPANFKRRELIDYT
jgi:hypothetical protein